MKTRAAVLRDVGEPFQVEDVELDDPQAGEVLVRMVATGLCHTDHHLMTGDLPVPLPMVPGHEGAGVVEVVGPGVTSVEPGDHVVLAFIPSCGHCTFCASGRSNLCELGGAIMLGPQLDGSFRFHLSDGEDAGQMCLLGTFAEKTVVPEMSVVKIEKHIPLRAAALIGCGVPTGFGAAVNRGKVRPGETVVVWGTGGIGMNAVQGAKIAGARTVIAVEPNPVKRKLATEVFGATHSVDPADGDPIDAVMDITWNRGADVSILTPGVLEQEILQKGLASLAKAGRAVLVAVPPVDADHLPIAPFDIVLFEREILGTVYGTSNPFAEIPKLLELYSAGHLKLDELVTRTYTLDQINEGYDDVLSGENIRGIVVYGDEA